MIFNGAVFPDMIKIQDGATQSYYTTNLHCQDHYTHFNSLSLRNHSSSPGDGFE